MTCRFGKLALPLIWFPDMAIDLPLNMHVGTAGARGNLPNGGRSAAVLVIFDIVEDRRRDIDRGVGAGNVVDMPMCHPSPGLQGEIVGQDLGGTSAYRRHFLHPRHGRYPDDDPTISN